MDGWIDLGDRAVDAKERIQFMQRKNNGLFQVRLFSVKSRIAHTYMVHACCFYENV